MGEVRSPELEALEMEVGRAKLVNMDLERQLLETKLRAELRVENTVLAQPDQHGEFLLAGDVTDGLMHRLMDQMELYSKRVPGGDIELTINSPGGSVLAGFALIDHMRLLQSRGHKITTKGVGYVASMAGIILQAGDERVLSDHAFFGMHEVSSQVSGSLSNQEDSIKFAKALQARAIELLTARSKFTSRTLQNAWARKDVHMSAAEALKNGLVDRVETL